MNNTMRRGVSVINLFLSLSIVLNLCFGYLEINDVVGKSIDANEAQYYRIFSDVPGFESARFLENADSVMIEINVVLNDTHQTWFQNVDKEIFRSIADYTKYFQKIIDDQDYRNRYIREHALGWPLFNQAEFDLIVSNIKTAKLYNTACCMMNAISGSAVAGGFVGREVVETISNECVTTHIFVVHPGPFWAVTAIGTTLGCAFSYGVFPSDPKPALVMKDIVAFDQYGSPITVQDFMRDEIYSSRTLNGIGGFLIGILVSGGTGLYMAFAYDGYSAKTSWDQVATIVPITVFTFSELITIMKMSIENGAKDDRKATIEKIKQKRNKERQKQIQIPADQ